MRASQLRYSPIESRSRLISRLPCLDESKPVTKTERESNEHDDTTEFYTLLQEKTKNPSKGSFMILPLGNNIVHPYVLGGSPQSRPAGRNYIGVPMLRYVE